MYLRSEVQHLFNSGLPRNRPSCILFAWNVQNKRLHRDRGLVVVDWREGAEWE